jgi:hypothetical protein
MRAIRANLEPLRCVSNSDDEVMQRWAGVAEHQPVTQLHRCLQATVDLGREPLQLGGRCRGALAADCLLHGVQELDVTHASRRRGQQRVQ